MTTTAKKDNDRFTIAVSCPGCGGELELDDNFFAIECKHCGSGHRILMPDSPPAFVAELKVTKQKARYAIDRYLKDKGLPLTHSDYQLKRMYYPYWKIDAVLFRVRKGIEKKVIVASSNYDEKEISYNKENSDVSLSPYTTSIQAGLNFDSLPASLGLRSEYLKLFPVSDEHIEEDFDLLPVLKPWDDVRKSLNQNIGAISSYDNNLFGVNKTSIHCPKAMLLYFPFFLFDFYDDDNFNRFVIDGVTGRVLNHVTSLKYESTSVESEKITLGEIAIVPHQCNNCGEDLPSKKSLVYICQNCQVITDLEPGVEIDSIKQVKHVHNSQNIFVPFWAFTMKGVDIKTLKSVFGGIYDSDRVVVPAFQVQNYNALFKLTKRMSAAYPQFKLETIEKLGSTYAPLNLALNEALSLTELFIKTDRFKKNISSKKEDFNFQLDKVSLFYAPFHLESYFYVDSVLQAVTFEKNLVD